MYDLLYRVFRWNTLGYVGRANACVPAVPAIARGDITSAVWALIVPSAIGDTVMVEVWVSGSVVSLLVLALIPGRVAEQL